MTSPTSFPLNAFESYMLADDRPDYPMVFVITLRFSGKFNRAAFDDAVATTAVRHPLLTAYVEGPSVEKLRWTPAADWRPFVAFVDGDEPLCFPEGRSQIDLRRETGWRLWVRARSDGVEWRLQFHHACCDGIGALQVVEDLLGAYHALVLSDDAAKFLKPLDLARLARRGAFGMTISQRLLRLPFEVWGSVIGLLTFFLRRPTAVIAPRPPGPCAEQQGRVPDLPSATFEKTELASLRAAAKQAGVTLNDWLLRDVFTAVASWNDRHRPGTGQRSLRVMVPFSLRNLGDRYTPAANIVGMVHIDRLMRLHRDPKQLLRSLAFEMNVHKRFNFAIVNVRICAALRQIPGLMRRVADAPRCRASTVLSNVGRLFSGTRLPRRDGKVLCGELTLESVGTAPPVRERTPITILALIYADRLVLTANYDRASFEPKDAELFVEALAAATRASIAAATDH